MNKMIIAVDFDGTIVEHAFPDIGEKKVGAIETLKKWQSKGHKIILWTCRANPSFLNIRKRRKLLSEAVEFCKKEGLVFDAVNKNVGGLGFKPPKPKIYADWYIDDRARFQKIDWGYLDLEFSLRIGRFETPS